VKYKKLVGGGLIKIVNNTVHSLMKLATQRSKPAMSFPTSTRMEKSRRTTLEDGDYPVFDCSLAPQAAGDRLPGRARER